MGYVQVLAASKNKISTLKGFPHLPVLEVIMILFYGYFFFFYFGLLFFLFFLFFFLLNFFLFYFLFACSVVTAVKIWRLHLLKQFFLSFLLVL